MSESGGWQPAEPAGWVSSASESSAVRTFDVYGSPTMPVLELRDRVAAALGLRFVERDSLYWGTYHESGGRAGEETVTVYDNVRFGDEEEPAYGHFPEAVSVVTVSTERRAVFERVLAGVGDLALLDHADLPPPAPPAPRTTFRDVWGSPSLDPGQVRHRLAAALDTSFAARTMPARGGTFHVATGPDGEEVTVTDNRVVIGMGGTVYDPDAPVTTVVEVGGPLAAADAIRGRLAGVGGLVLVRHR